MPHYPNDIEYSVKYSDDVYQYRHVILPQAVARELYTIQKMYAGRPRLLEDAEWRNLGVTQSRGWEHYGIHQPEPHILLFRRPLGTDPITGKVAVVAEQDSLVAGAAAKAEMERVPTDAASQVEQDRLATQAAAKAEAERLAAEAADKTAAEAVAKAEAERLAAEAAVKTEEERFFPSAVAKVQAATLAAEAGDKVQEVGLVIVDRPGTEAVAIAEADILAALAQDQAADDIDDESSSISSATLLANPLPEAVYEDMDDEDSGEFKEIGVAKQKKKDRAKFQAIGVAKQKKKYRAKVGNWHRASEGRGRGRGFGRGTWPGRGKGKGKGKVPAAPPASGAVDVTARLAAEAAEKAEEERLAAKAVAKAEAERLAAEAAEKADDERSLLCLFPQDVAEAVANREAERRAVAAADAARPSSRVESSYHVAQGWVEIYCDRCKKLTGQKKYSSSPGLRDGEAWLMRCYDYANARWGHKLPLFRTKQVSTMPPDKDKDIHDWIHERRTCCTDPGLASAPD